MEHQRWEIREGDGTIEVVNEGGLVTQITRDRKEVVFDDTTIVEGVTPMVDYKQVIVLKPITYQGVTFYNTSVRDSDGNLLKHFKGELSPQEALAKV